MEQDRWTLIVEFDSIQETIRTNNYEGGVGEAGEFYSFLREYWGSMDPEELDECIVWKDETVTATTDIIDSLSEPIKWIMAYSVPKSMTLTRNESRSRGLNSRE
jgi:hypothetical protein